MSEIIQKMPPYSAKCGLRGPVILGSAGNKQRTEFGEGKYTTNDKYDTRQPRSTHGYVEYSSKNAVFTPKRKLPNGSLLVGSQAEKGEKPSLIADNGENASAEVSKAKKKSRKNGRHRVLPQDIGQPIKLTNTNNANKTDCANQWKDKTIQDTQELGYINRKTSKNNQTFEDQFPPLEVFSSNKNLLEKSDAEGKQAENMPIDAAAIIEAETVLVNQPPQNTNETEEKEDGGNIICTHEIEIIEPSSTVCNDVIDTNANTTPPKNTDEVIIIDPQRQQQVFEKLHPRERENQFHKNRFPGKPTHPSTEGFSRTRKFPPKVGNTRKAGVEDAFATKQGRKNICNTAATAVKADIEAGLCKRPAFQKELSAVKQQKPYEKKCKPLQNKNGAAAPWRNATKIAMQQPEILSNRSLVNHGNPRPMQKQRCPPYKKMARAGMNAGRPPLMASPNMKPPLLGSVIPRGGRAANNKIPKIFITPCGDQTPVFHHPPPMSAGSQFLHPYSQFLPANPQVLPPSSNGLLPSPQVHPYSSPRLLPLPHQFPSSHYLPPVMHPLLPSPPPGEYVQNPAYPLSPKGHELQMANDHAAYGAAIPKEEPLPLPLSENVEMHQNIEPNHTLDSNEIKHTSQNSSTDHVSFPRNMHPNRKPFMPSQQIAAKPWKNKAEKNKYPAKSDDSRSTSASNLANSIVTPESTSTDSGMNMNFFGNPMALNIGMTPYGTPAYHSPAPMLPPAYSSFRQMPGNNYYASNPQNQYYTPDIPYEELMKLPVGTYVHRGCMYFPNPADSPPKHGGVNYEGCVYYPKPVPC
ncbi:hypothetical protein IE077_002097 [Cardiosporidium cionae]|uniref:Uncharacterized protein n=1 Tax=Cardiosporidium cionae TaxID=476202 RepID=A0ABQ7JBK5_9APIC|nr:hypothetical protein IE077_002097 [Cardiosporidium cionae]|eukprot:KAF8821379.1 hypothetical protein IE077_002097 [Cardiosporidium cionae]